MSVCFNTEKGIEHLRLIWIIAEAPLEVLGCNGLSNDTEIVSIQDRPDGSKDGDKKLIDLWLEHHDDGCLRLYSQ